MPESIRRITHRTASETAGILSPRLFSREQNRTFAALVSRKSAKTDEPYSVKIIALLCL
jgi:hypothetical protein